MWGRSAVEVVLSIIPALDNQQMGGALSENLMWKCARLDQMMAAVQGMAFHATIATTTRFKYFYTVVRTVHALFGGFHWVGNFLRIMNAG